MRERVAKNQAPKRIVEMQQQGWAHVGTGAMQGNTVELTFRCGGGTR